jgi:hypothetical protein
MPSRARKVRRSNGFLRSGSHDPKVRTPCSTMRQQQGILVGEDEKIAQEALPRCVVRRLVCVLPSPPPGTSHDASRAGALGSQERRKQAEVHGPSQALLSMIRSSA